MIFTKQVRDCQIRDEYIVFPPISYTEYTDKTRLYVRTHTSAHIHSHTQSCIHHINWNTRLTIEKVFFSSSLHRNMKKMGDVLSTNWNSHKIIKKKKFNSKFIYGQCISIQMLVQFILSKMMPTIFLFLLPINITT